MKRILITLAILALGTTGFAQRTPNRFGGREPIRHYGDRPGRGFGYDIGSELEFGFCVNYFTGREFDGVKTERPDRIGLFGEYRMDLGGYMDMGMQLSTTFGKGTILTGDSVQQKAWYWQGASLLVADFNLMPYSGFNPFVGFGLGPGFGFEKITSEPKGSEWTHALVLAPRVGVELFECFRMSVQYQWYLNDPGKYSHFSFGLSWAFEPGMGGRRPFGR